MYNDEEQQLFDQLIPKSGPSRRAGKSRYEVLQIENNRLSLPTTSSDRDTYPVGTAVSFTSQRRFDFENHGTLMPCPLVFILDTYGRLLSYSAINLKSSKTSTICVAAKAMQQIRTPAEPPKTNVSAAPQQQQPKPAAAPQANPLAALTGATNKPAGPIFGAPPAGSAAPAPAIGFGKGPAGGFNLGSAPTSGFNLAQKPAGLETAQAPISFGKAANENMFNLGGGAQPAQQTSLSFGVGAPAFGSANQVPAPALLSQKHQQPQPAPGGGLQIKPQQPLVQQQQQQQPAFIQQQNQFQQLQQQQQQAPKPVQQQVQVLAPVVRRSGDPLATFNAFKHEFEEFKQTASKFIAGKHPTKSLIDTRIVKDTKIVYDQQYQTLNKEMKALTDSCSDLRDSLMTSLLNLEKLRSFKSFVAAKNAEGKQFMTGFQQQQQQMSWIDVDPTAKKRYEDLKRLFYYLESQIPSLNGFIDEYNQRKQGKLAKTLPLSRIYETISIVERNIHFNSEKINRVINQLKLSKFGQTRFILSDLNLNTQSSSPRLKSVTSYDGNESLRENEENSSSIDLLGKQSNESPFAARRMSKTNPSFSKLKDSPSQLLANRMAGINISSKQQAGQKGLDQSDYVDEDEESVKAKITLMVEKDIKFYTKLYNLLKKRQLKPNQVQQHPQIPTQSLRLQEIRYLDDSKLQDLDVDARNKQASLTGFKQSQQSPMQAAPKQAQPKITPVQSQPAPIQQQQFAPQPQAAQQLQFLLQQQQQQQQQIQQQQIQFPGPQMGQQLKSTQQIPAASLNQSPLAQALSQKIQQPIAQPPSVQQPAPTQIKAQPATTLSSLLGAQVPIISSTQPPLQQQPKPQPAAPQPQQTSLFGQSKQPPLGTPPNANQSAPDSGAVSSTSQPGAPAVNLFGAPTTSTPFSFGTPQAKPAAAAQPAPQAQKSLFQNLAPATETKSAAPAESQAPTFPFNLGAKPAAAPATSVVPPATTTTQPPKEAASQPPKFTFGFQSNAQPGAAPSVAPVIKPTPQTQIPVPAPAETKPAPVPPKTEAAQPAVSTETAAKPPVPSATSALPSQIPVPVSQPAAAKPAAATSLFGSSSNLFGSAATAAAGGQSGSAPAFSFSFGNTGAKPAGSLFGAPPAAAAQDKPKPAEATTAPKEPAAAKEPETAAQPAASKEPEQPKTAPTESKPEAQAPVPPTATAAASSATSAQTVPTQTPAQPPVVSPFSATAPATTAPAATSQVPNILGASTATTTTTTAAPAVGTGLFSGFLQQPASTPAASNPFTALAAKQTQPQPPATAAANNELDMADMDSGNGNGAASSGGGLSFGGLGFGTKAPDAAAAAKNVFGGSLFGGQSAAQPAPSLFGSQPASGSPGGVIKTSAFGFGAQASQPQPAAGFGASATPSAFGGAANTSAGAGGLFSSFKTPQKPSFGSPAPAFGGGAGFGAPAAFGSQPVFGGQPTFGSPAAAPTGGSLFGSFSATPSSGAGGSLFGGGGATNVGFDSLANKPLFGSTTGQPDNKPTGFGALAASSGSTFGGFGQQPQQPAFGGGFGATSPTQPSGFTSPNSSSFTTYRK